jgi:2-C-methyl-D-erythritol 2,4-cyclodiphosphate synthase
VRVGIGWDLHRLVAGRPLVIGGVRLPFDRGEEGFSDGDAATHAIIDALLGAASLGDIGRHFPPGDPRWRGISSRALLVRVRSMLEEAGWRIGNVDVTVALEAPKIGPRAAEIRETIAADLGLEAAAVSVKGKTAEGLGDVGRGEAIEAWAVALIERSAP